MEPWSEAELKAKIGQLFIVGFHGHVPTDNIKTLITEHKVGSIILFQRNISSAPQLLKLTNSLQEIARSTGHEQPLLISIDQENGLVTRICPPIAAQLPGSMALAATGDVSNAFKVASATAEVLNAVGINMNYAPVADVNSEPKNPVIGVRSPSDDPETVGRFVGAQIKGFQECRIVPCVKHFPGHGDTTVDSHSGLPVVEKSRDQLDACELVPFRRAIVQGVNAVMMAHISLPGIADQVAQEGLKTLPASLNPDAVRILRDDMGYDGLIVTDCLEMDGVRAEYGTENGAVMALKADCDCIMICHNMDAQVGAIEQVIQAVRSGELSQDKLQASFDTVRALKSKFLADITYPTPALRPEVAEGMMSRHSALATELYSRSTTVVRSVPGVFPVSKDSAAKIYFLRPDSLSTNNGAFDIGDPSSVHVKFAELLREQNCSVVDVSLVTGKPLSSDIDKALENSDVVILVTSNANLNCDQRKLGLSLGKRLGRKLIVVAACDPYDFLEDDDEVRNYITTYEPTIPAFKSAVDIIFENIQAQGKLPVGSAALNHDIRRFDGSGEHLIAVRRMWDQIFPEWYIAIDRLANILRHKTGHHFLHEHGFCIAFLADELNGKIAALGVLKSHRGKGIGTALLRRAQTELKGTVRGSSRKTLGSLEIGSAFPRFWPEVPKSFPQEAKDFFSHRDITQDIAPAHVLERVAKFPFQFAPWSEELYEECMIKQRRNFGGNAAWINAYESLAAAYQYHEVMVAFDKSGKQIGWTLMCSPNSSVCRQFAFLPLMPTQEKTGLIACVGVDQKARGQGVGLALLIKAMENMRERGIEGVLIDWVVLRGFYEKLGFEAFWEYESYEW